MTASTPNPADSGAAASRDAARTARRLTDGTLPRTSPPPATATVPPPAARPETEGAVLTAPPEAPASEEAPEAVEAAEPATPVVPDVPDAPPTTRPATETIARVGTPTAATTEPEPEPAEPAEPEAGPDPDPDPEPEPPAPAAPVVTATVTIDTTPKTPATAIRLEKAEAEAPAEVPAEVPAEAAAPHEALDFGRIKGARVAAVALPVAGVVRVTRRKNVIGAETTGAIPVHLLFRDEPEAPAPGRTDDGGPDTVTMPAPEPLPAPAPASTPTPTRASAPAPKVRTSVVPAPSPLRTPLRTPDRTERAPEPRPRKKPRARHAAPAPVSRPAPTADPALVERPGAVLPGWTGALAGVVAVLWCAAVVWWTGAVPAGAARMLGLPVRPYHGVHLGQWAAIALGVVAALFAFGGLGRGRVGYAWVLSLFGDYRGTVRRTGLIWVSPLLLRRRVDVRLRHWRSEPLPAVDARGTALDVVVLVVWRVRDTVLAALGVDGHEEYLREQVEAAMARVLSQLPADAFHEDAPTLRDAEAVGEALTRMLSAECAPVGIDVFSAQPTRIEYAPEVAAAMRRSRIAALDAKHRDAVLTSVVDAVDDVVHRLTSRGLVELDDYERKTLVKDLTVAFYTGRSSAVEGA